MPTASWRSTLQTRTAAGLFDVSHMGQAFLVGPDHEATARALEALVPADIRDLAPGRQRYTQLLNEAGGILDDLMVTRSADPTEDGVLMLVVNAARKDADFAHLAAALPAGVRLLRADHRALIALQGPQAAPVLARHCADADRHGVHDGLEHPVRRHRLSRQPLRLYRRGRLRDLREGAAAAGDRASGCCRIPR